MAGEAGDEAAATTGAAIEVDAERSGLAAADGCLQISGPVQ